MMRNVKDLLVEAVVSKVDAIKLLSTLVFSGAFMLRLVLLALSANELGFPSPFFQRNNLVSGSDYSIDQFLRVINYQNANISFLQVSLGPDLGMLGDAESLAEHYFKNRTGGTRDGCTLPVAGTLTKLCCCEEWVPTRPISEDPLTQRLIAEGTVLEMSSSYTEGGNILLNRVVFDRMLGPYLCVNVETNTIILEQLRLNQVLAIVVVIALAVLLAASLYHCCYIFDCSDVVLLAKLGFDVAWAVFFWESNQRLVKLASSREVDPRVINAELRKASQFSFYELVFLVPTSLTVLYSLAQVLSWLSQTLRKFLLVLFRTYFTLLVLLLLLALYLFWQGVLFLVLYGSSQSRFANLLYSVFSAFSIEMACSEVYECWIVQIYSLLEEVLFIYCMASIAIAAKLALEHEFGLQSPSLLALLASARLLLQHLKKAEKDLTPPVDTQAEQRQRTVLFSPDEALRGHCGLELVRLSAEGQYLEVHYYLSSMSLLNPGLLYSDQLKIVIDCGMGDPARPLAKICTFLHNCGAKIPILLLGFEGDLGPCLREYSYLREGSLRELQDFARA